MSLRRWNTVKERSLASNLLNLSLLIWLRSRKETDDGLESEDDSSFCSSLSDSSSSSDSSFSFTTPFSSSSEEERRQSRISHARNLVCLALQYAQMLYEPIEDPSITWHANVPIISDISESEALIHFRFRKEHLQILSDLLLSKIVPQPQASSKVMTVKNRYRIHFETGFLMLLFRLAHPRRLHGDMERFFHLRRSHISAVLTTFVELFFHVGRSLLSDPALFRNKIPEYAAVIERKTDIPLNIWGFIDGTLRKTARPLYFQRSTYSGHKRVHGLKFQSVVTPDGLIANLHGPESGKTHDLILLRLSGLRGKLETLMPIDGVMYALYGDPAYRRSAYLLAGFRNAPEGSIEREFNRIFSSAREVVEWGFKEVIQQWTFLDFKRAMKIFQFPVGKWYTTAVFLTNCRTCFYGNQISHFFDCEPLSINEYIGMVNL